MSHLPDNVHTLPDYSGRVAVFEGRREAGEILAEQLAPLRRHHPLILAIPAGGVPVAEIIARRLAAPLSVVVTSKATPPWNSEVGFAAVAFDGSEVVDTEIAHRLGLDDAAIQAALARAREKVRRRQHRFLGKHPLPDVAGRTVILVDDGLASGKTMEAAISALRNAGVRQLVVAVPTGHDEAVRRVAPLVDAVYCPNLRSGFRYAVADAYQHWRDVSEEEVDEILAKTNDPSRHEPLTGQKTRNETKETNQ